MNVKSEKKILRSVSIGNGQLALPGVETSEAVYATHRKIVRCKTKEGGSTLTYGEILFNNKKLTSRSYVSSERETTVPN
jgi:hypothetical protein